MGFGVAGTFGQVKEPLNTVVYRTGGRSSFFRFADGVIGDGQRQRIAPQLFLYAGSLGVLSEYYDSRQRLRKGATAETVRFSGLNVQATYVLTGERTSFRNVAPRQPYDPTTGKGGAYEVALRYSRVKLDDMLFVRGFANRNNASETTDAYTLGLNWYVNRNCKAILNYEHTEFSAELEFTNGKRRREDALLTQFQIQF